MIAETRERSSKDGGVYNVEQKLQAYLRDKYSIDSISNIGKQEQIIRLLMQIAKDWCIKHNDYKSDIEYAKIAKDAIATYINNWSNKQQGLDNRSHAFGRINI